MLRKVCVSGGKKSCVIDALATLNVTMCCLDLALEAKSISVDMEKAKVYFNVNPIELVQEKLLEVYQTLSAEVAKCDSLEDESGG